MNYEQFVEKLQECIAKRLQEDEKVERQEVLKNNGQKLIGFTIQRQGETVVPIIYLEEFYQRYLRGEKEECLTEEIMLLRNSVAFSVCEEYGWIRDFQKIQNRIVYRLVNFEKNSELLKEVPHLSMLDFAAIFCAIISEGISLDYVLLIRNEHLQLWKIPITVLYETARTNTPRRCPPIFRPISSFIGELGTPLWVLTNEQGSYGASVLLYPGILQKIHEKLQDNYYLLPSSVHEFLILPKRHAAFCSDLKEIVFEANRTVIEQGEFLSDNIYYFNGNNITKV